MRSFAGIATLPFQPAVIGVPLDLATPSKYPPTVVPISVNWLVPWQQAGNPASVGVLLNLEMGTGGQRPPLDKIQSVYVDNYNSSVPVYVVFPSTGFTITAPPGTSTWYPVITNNLVVEVFVIGLTAGFIPTTGIWFSNVIMQPYSDAEINQTIVQNLASAAITRGSTIYNTNFGIPALGDQTAQYNGTANAAVLFNNLWGTPLASGFIYLTNVTFDVLGYNSGAASSGLATMDFFIESTGVAGILYTFSPRVRLAGANTVYPIFNVCSITGNIKLDATQTWRLRGANILGWNSDFSLITQFTTNPN
jgi:hypothetical protein